MTDVEIRMYELIHQMEPVSSPALTDILYAEGHKLNEIDDAFDVLESRPKIVYDVRAFGWRPR